MTVFPDPDPETSTFDGLARRTNAAQEAWSTRRNGAGDNAVDTVNPLYCMRIVAGTVADTWSEIVRGLFLFDTSPIADTDTIDSATLSLFGTAKTDPATAISPDINIYQATTASNTAASNSDYENAGTTAFSTAITFANYSITGYNDFALNASGLANISKTGISKFSSRNANYDVANSAPTWSNSTDHEMRCNHAEAAGTANDPQLVVNSTAGGGSKLLLLNVGT